MASRTKKEPPVSEAPPLSIDEPGFLATIDAMVESGLLEETTDEDQAEAAALYADAMPVIEKHSPTRDKFIAMGNGLYLPVRQRIVWMRGEPEPHPEWLIQTELMQFREGDYQGNKSVLLGGAWQDVPNVTGGLAVVQARVLTVLPNGKEGPVIGEGMAMERSELFHDFVEKAETAAIGRALAVAGYGTEAALDLDEGPDNIADAPVRRPLGAPGAVMDGVGAGDTAITITPSAVPGVRQGGRQANATPAQIAAIRQRAGELMLAPSKLQEIIRQAVPPDPTEDVPDFYLEDVDDSPDGTNLVLGFLAQLSFADCGKVVLAIADPAKGA